MKETSLKTIVKIRLEKLKALKKAGMDPYPAQVTRKALAGRISSIRYHGGSIFAHLENVKGKIQIYLKRDVLNKDQRSKIKDQNDKSKIKNDLFILFKEYIDIGDFIEAEGEYFRTKTGEKTLLVKNWRLLAKSLRPLPEKWHGLKDKEIRYRQRYLDLIFNPEVKKTFIIRSQVIEVMRQFLLKRGYLEVETPVLQPIYGGGLARPFKTYHNVLGIPMYLRISTELYLKRLIVGGFEKVFEIAHLFRNEGIDKMHNPEFTLLETMEAYIDYKENMKVVEEMTFGVVSKVLRTHKVTFKSHKIDFKIPWKRISMIEAVKKVTGIDFKKVKTLKEAQKAAQKVGVELEKFSNSLGMILAQIFEEKVEPTLIQPTIVYDFPYETSPLAKRCRDNPNFVERFEHFIAGMEMSNNYSELNDPQELTRRFKDERKKERLGDEETHQTDQDFIEALEYGMPPTSGIGPSIDRLVMILTNSATIRDVILFPTLRPK